MKEKSYKKEQLELLRYARAANLAQYLKDKCDECDKQTEYGSNSGDDSVIRLNTLTTVLSKESSIVYESLTFKGYCVVIGLLLKIALFHKEFNGYAKTLWGFVI